MIIVSVPVYPHVPDNVHWNYNLQSFEPDITGIACNKYVIRLASVEFETC